MDLSSMCQDCGDIFKGYQYELHTRPIVEQLHIIVSSAEECCILLNTQDSTNPDPLDVKTLYCQMIGRFFRQFSNLFMDWYFAFLPFVERENDLSFWNLHQECHISDIIEDEEFWISVQLSHQIDWKGYIESPSRKSFETQDDWNGFNAKESLRKLIKGLDIIDNGFFPTNEYFGRLWCYVERLGMNENSIFVYPGRQQILMSDHLNSLWNLCDLVYILGEHAKLVWGKNMLSVLPSWKWDYRDLRNSLRVYDHRCRQLFGRHYRPSEHERLCIPSSVPVTLGPFAQVELLHCYCDADRVVVMEIEAKLRGETVNKREWVAGLQICLGSPVLSPDTSIFREPVGRVRKISSIDFDPNSTDPDVISSEMFFSDPRIITSWALQSGYLSSNVLRYSSRESLVLRTRSIQHSYRCTQEMEVCTINTMTVQPRDRRIIHENYFQCICHFGLHAPVDLAQFGNLISTKIIR
jgi:hypothetical protein